MYKPLTPTPIENVSPDEADAIAEANERLRQYVLTTGEVAKLLDVSNQRVLQWVDQKRIEVFRDKKASRTTYRFSLADVVNAEVAKTRKLHVYTLPIEFMQQYSTISLSKAGDRLLFSPLDPAKHARKWMSESQAARVLDMKRTTLRLHRVSGRLNEEVITREHPSTTVGGVQYEVAAIKRVASGEISLYGPEAPAEHEVD